MRVRPCPVDIRGVNHTKAVRYLFYCNVIRLFSGNGWSFQAIIAFHRKTMELQLLLFKFFFFTSYPLLTSYPLNIKLQHYLEIIWITCCLPNLCTHIPLHLWLIIHRITNLIQFGLPREPIAGLVSAFQNKIVVSNLKFHFLSRLDLILGVFCFGLLCGWAADFQRTCCVCCSVYINET